jgi:hypothetical protein
MKFAISQTGKTIQAAENAPQKALCPNCKGIVILRTRKRSNKPGDVTYFWRHESHVNPSCPARFRYD